MRRDDERRAGAERRDQSARNEEVRVHDVRPPRAHGAPCKLEVAQLAARTRVEHRVIDVVAAIDELPLDLGDEGAEVRRGRPGIHLRDEQDPHAKSV